MLKVFPLKIQILLHKQNLTQALYFMNQIWLPWIELTEPVP